MSEDPQLLLKTAIEAAREAGKYIVESLGSLKAESIAEKRSNDFVTTVDKTSENLIVSHIQNHFPQHSILAEEGGASVHSGDYQWIIDPLDGTTNFIKEIPVFAVSIGVRHGDDMVAGVVYNPAQEELFSALRGCGAYLNDQPISVSGLEDFQRAFLATGFPHQKKKYLPQYITAFSEIFYHHAGARRLGAAALDLCYTACGRFDAFWELGLNPWDIAAGSLIVEEAGGVITDFWHKNAYLDSGFVAAATPGVHHKLVEFLSIHFEEHRHE